MNISKTVSTVQATVKRKALQVANAANAKRHTLLTRGGVAATVVAVPLFFVSPVLTLLLSTAGGLSLAAANKLEDLPEGTDETEETE